jgi:hypothetical protein
VLLGQWAPTRAALAHLDRHWGLSRSPKAQQLSIRVRPAPWWRTAPESEAQNLFASLSVKAVLAVDKGEFQTRNAARAREVRGTDPSVGKDTGGLR